MTPSIPDDVLREIFKYGFSNIKFLHSCLLINKNWCNVVVPILWNRPFHLLFFQPSHKLISTYIACIKDSCSKINATSSQIHPAFNYPSFLRHLSYNNFLTSVQEWCSVNNVNSFYSVSYSLIRLFATFSPKLETLKFNLNLKFANFVCIKNQMVISESKVDCWISSVEELQLEGYFFIDQNFSGLLNYCKDIKKVNLKLPINSFLFGYDYYVSSVNVAAQLIVLQRSLSHFTFSDSHFSNTIGNALKQQIKLKHLVFMDVAFDLNSPLDWLPHCVELESLTFINSDILHPEILLPIVFSPLKQLKSLNFTEELVPVEALESLMRASNEKLQEIVFGWPEDCKQCGFSNVLRTISSFCPNLTKFGAVIGFDEISHFINVLKKCGHLQIIEIYGNGSVLDVNEYLPELGKYLPPKLSELNVGAKWIFRVDTLARFFENSKSVPLCKFGIKIYDFINDGHLEIILIKSMQSLKYFTLNKKKFAKTLEGIKDASAWLRKL